jgi:hypothetical protein
MRYYYLFTIFLATMVVATVAFAQPAPTYIAPPDQTPCPGTGPFSMDFSWNPVPGATAYRFTLERFVMGVWVLYADVTNVQTSTRSNGLMNGYYRWRVASQPSGSWGPYWYLIENPLPVQLASFTGRAISPTAVQLNWTTLSEINNYGFDVQRRPSGVTEWSTIGFVPGNGTTLQRHDYTFTDNSVTSGTWQYRLVQIDLDGRRNEIEPIRVVSTSVAEEIPLEFALEQNYPNPFNPSTTIQFTVTDNDPVTLKVYNLIGQEVATLVDETLAPGTYTCTFDAAGLASGVYLYRLQSGKDTATMPAVLQK